MGPMVKGDVKGKRYPNDIPATCSSYQIQLFPQRIVPIGYRNQLFFLTLYPISTIYHPIIYYYTHSGIFASHYSNEYPNKVEDVEILA
jgi:hypothetical protein